MNSQIGKWFWAYRHINDSDGKVRVKTYRGNYNTVRDAHGSDFVVNVVEPFEHTDRESAIIYARKMIYGELLEK